ncbi:hypothetical protein QBC40DRAFT_164858 [Triangularia verruculosa]|uniref:Uncharacterized protein n=1 Tax=Triangularia verruculosa TaxID=2587418 RepID=A0AAN6XRN5_9PEZI|nr:hypothetical protein QBC40DRAFT_164858 [Triangularia verruculosa]
MDQVELAVDPGPLGQLEREAELDFDADGFDFQLDGVYDQADETQKEAPTVTTESATEQVDEIGYEDDDEDIHLESAVSDPTKTVGAQKDQLGAGNQYQEEIGYEEDYNLTTELVNVDEITEDLAAADSEQPEYQAEDKLDSQLEYQAEDQVEYQAEDQPEPRPEDLVDQTQTHGQEDQAVSQGSTESEKPTAEQELHQQVDDDDDDEKENVPEPDNHSDMDYDVSDHAAVHEDYLMEEDEEPRTGLSEVDRAIEDLASSLHGVPDIEVFYNDVSYSLFGTSNDDLESYFLSDITKLDEPLAQLLSSLRQVIANEIAPTDTLLVSFDSLDLEFGEKSSERFLKRTLRELLDCHAALAAKDSAIASIPVLQLIAQHDCEERFLQLLDEAKYGGESPRHSEHEYSEVEHSEHEQSDHEHSEHGESANPEWPAGEFQGGEQDELAQARSENQASVDDENTRNDESTSTSVSPIAQTGDEFKLETDAENDDSIQNEDTAPLGAPSPAPAATAEGQPESGNESVYQETAQNMDADYLQAPADSAQDQASYEGIDDQEQVSYEGIDDDIDEQEMKDADEEFDVNTELEIAEEAHITSNGVLEQTAGSNDDDLLLAFDQDGGLLTIDEQDGDDAPDGETLTAVVSKASNNLVDSNEDALETDLQVEISQVSRGVTPAMSKNSPQEPSAAATGDTGSDHTSSTMNGDEIDYDEHDVDNSFTPDNSAPHSVVAPLEDGDEIDWGNDGDEYEDGHGGDEGDITLEAQPDHELTPSSPTGKRYRTDDAESLAEESGMFAHCSSLRWANSYIRTDHKRRRT